MPDPSPPAGRLDPAVARARSAVRAGLADVHPGATVLVGLSGGADSLALTAAATVVAVEQGWGCGAVVVDHALQVGSAGVARSAATAATALGADPVVLVAAPASPGSRAGPEGAARQARHDALRAAAVDAGAVAVLLAHTRDDQAETVLLGLARGSGARSLAGIRPRAGLLRRPFLDLTRSDTEAVCAAYGLAPWTDPHNDDRGHTRVRVRRGALPALEDALGPGVRKALARTADLLRDDADLLDSLAADLFESVRVTPEGPAGGVSQQKRHAQRGLGMRVGGLAAAPAALRGRVLRAAALQAGCPATDLSAGHVRAVARLVTDWHGQRGVDLPGPLHAVRRDGVLLVLPGRCPRGGRAGAV